MGQDVEVFAKAGIDIASWAEAEAPARRRRWYDSGDGMLAVLLASASDVDDLVPTLVAFQIEWNKIRQRQRAAGWPVADMTPELCAAELGGRPDDWARLREAWGDRFAERMELNAGDRLSMRVRMLGGSHIGYARLTRRWWSPVREQLAAQELDRQAAVLRQLEHALDREHRHAAWRATARTSWSAFVEALPDSDILRAELDSFRAGESEGSWENFLYFVARDYWDARGEEGRAERGAAEKACGDHAPALADRAARAGADHAAEPLEPREARPAAGRRRRRRAGGLRRGDRQHRLSARRGGLQHPARGGRRQLARCAASTCSARRPR